MILKILLVKRLEVSHTEIYSYNLFMAERRWR
jgi:hypothetical protein